MYQSLEVKGASTISDYDQNPSSTFGFKGNKARKIVSRTRKPSMGRDLDEFANTAIKNPASLLTSKRLSQQFDQGSSETA